jgi:hypothetical protein
MVRRSLACWLLAALIIGAASFSRNAASQTEPVRPRWTTDPASDAFIYEEHDDIATCRPASVEEARAINDRPRESLVRVLPRGAYEIQSTGGLNIVLQGTQQLNNFPEARDAFIRAADTWKSKIDAPITVIIDVDFGPTRFGQPYPQDVLGSTTTQGLFSSDGYSDVRAGLVSRTAGTDISDVINALPPSQVPTDIGSTAGSSAPSALLRALGIIAPVADPDSEPQFGNPPSIGFNSNFLFDFDPSDGIDPDKIDFDAVATHEIAHALAFTSRVGALELNPQTPLATTVFDLYRFRPGTVPANFSTAPRILSSGGDQVFFADLPELPLSTGRQDGSGGDHNQASHWKDEQIVFPPIGIMIPALAKGDRHTVTDNDLRALRLAGYKLAGADGGGDDEGDPGGPTLKKVAYDGSVMTIKGSPFNGTLELEVNDELVAPPLNIKRKSSGKKLKIKGSASGLNLHSGSNRIRVIANGLRSAVVTFNF